MQKTFPLQTSHRPPQLRFLLPNDVRPEVAILPSTVSLFANLFGQVEYQGYRKTMKFLCQPDQRLAGFRLDICGVHHGQMSQSQPFAGNKMQQFKRLVRNRLIVFIVGNHAPANVRRENFRRQKVLSGESAFTGTTWTNEDDEGKVGYGDGHRNRLDDYVE